MGCVKELLFAVVGVYCVDNPLDYQSTPHPPVGLLGYVRVRVRCQQQRRTVARVTRLPEPFSPVSTPPPPPPCGFGPKQLTQATFFEIVHCALWHCGIVQRTKSRGGVWGAYPPVAALAAQVRGLVVEGGEAEDRGNRAPTQQPARAGICNNCRVVQSLP